MRKFLTLLAALLIALPLSLPASAEQNPGQPPTLYAEAAILVDADTGQVLYQKNPDKKMYPASITKLMTCLIAMEEAQPDDVVTMTDEAVFAVPRDTTHIALTGGEQLTVEQLEYAMMVESANDAANGLAVHLAGSLEAFARRMNSRAAELGLQNTNFVNANGLPNTAHYTSARDMAVITREAYGHPEFRTLAGTTHYEIPPTNKQAETRRLNNRNYMFTLNDTYPGAFAGKVGWTEESGHTLVTLAERGGVTLICIVLHSDGVIDAQYIGSTNLFDYGFGAFSRTAVPASKIERREAPYTGADGGTLTASLAAEGEVSVLLPAGTTADDLGVRYSIPDPLTPKTAAEARAELVLPSPPGRMEELVGTVPLALSLPQPETMPADAAPPEDGKGPLPMLLRWAGILGGVLLGLAVLLLAVRAVLRARYRKMRRRRRRVNRAAPPQARPRPRPETFIDVRTGKDAKDKIRIIDVEELK